MLPCAIAEDRPSRHRAWTLALCLGLAGLTFLIFGPAIHFGFINFDDNRYVDHNPKLEAGLSARGLQWAFTANLTHLTETAEYWEPLTLVSRLADYQFYGFAPGGHHLTSILIHLATGLALFGALRQLTGARWRSAVVAALFLVHPMHVEPVIWLSARKDLVSALFYALTLWAYGWHAARPGRGRYVAFCAAFVAANMAKPMAVSLPAVLLLLDLWPLGRVRPEEAGWRRRVLLLVYRKLPFFFVAVGVSLLAYWVQKDIGAVADDGLLPLPWRIGAAVVGIGNYLFKAVVPIELTLFYPHPGRDLPVAQTVAVGLGLLLISAGAGAQWRRRPWLTVGWFFFLAVLAPVAGIVQVGDQAMADRYSYLAFIGLFIAVVWQVGAWAEQSGAPRACADRLTGLLTGGLLVVFSVLAFQQVQTWRTSESVFRHAIAVTDGNHVAHFNLGATLWEQGRKEEAWFHMTEAGRLREPFLRYQLVAAEEALARGAYDEASPRLVRVLMLMPWDSNLRQKLGTILVRNGEPGKALVQFNEALKYQPKWVQPRLSIAEVLMAQGQPERAERVLRDVLSVEPDSARARNLLESLATRPPVKTASEPERGSQPL
jgi:hypothetical protein